MPLILDISSLPYPQRLTAAALQGLLNRDGPNLLLDYGYYDDISARRTNEEFISDDLWFHKFRAYVGDQDLENAQFFTRRFGLTFDPAPDLTSLVRSHRDQLHGAVVWDPDCPDSVNVALIYAGLEDLLVVHPSQLNWIAELGLPICYDLRGRWTDRLTLYAWALDNLFPYCKSGQAACVEPGWQRPEFADYLVQNRIFPYSLSCKSTSRVFSLGQTLLLLLIAGPGWLRNLLFDLRLDGLVRSLGLWLMGRGSPETRLATRLLHQVQPRPYPTLFGWHTRRDDEFAFMLHLSACGLRLVPAHLASNYSFHAQVPCPELTPAPPAPKPAALDQNLTYLTFTLSDGDQLVLMDTAELGNWRRPERGTVPMNWEVQPLLAEIAPALLEQYTCTLAPGDCLIAGPSGAGYVIPPLVPDFPRYLAETARVCEKSGVRTLTSYIADPPRRLVRQMLAMPGEWTGFLAGYAQFGAAPAYRSGKRAFVANTWPTVAQIPYSSEDVLAGVRKLIEAPGAKPRFIGVHLFAYRTSVADVAAFVKTLDPTQVKVVNASEFLQAARQANLMIVD